MIKCESHPKRMRGSCKGCNAHLYCRPAKHCTTITAHDKYMISPTKRKIIGIAHEKNHCVGVNIQDMLVVKVWTKVMMINYPSQEYHAVKK